MTYHGVAFRAASAAYFFERPGCPGCGETLLLPEAAEFAGEGSIRHAWVCDNCGHTFYTAVTVFKCSRTTPN